MTKRYTLDLRLKDPDGVFLIDLHVERKTLETVHQLIRISMSDFEKVEPLPKPKHRWGRKPQRVEPPPIETISGDGPTEADIEGL